MPNENNLGASFSIDVTSLKAGLAQANRLIRESESEFKAAAAGMDDWSKSEAGLTAKIKSLNQITEIQSKKVNALQSEYDRLIADGLDPTSKEAVELRTKINNETAALEKNKSQTAELEQALNDFREEAQRTGKSVDEVAQNLDDMDDKAKEAADGFTIVKGAVATFAGNALTSLVDGLKNSASALMNLSQETQEYREDIGKLKTAFEAAGKSTETATATYKEFYSVLGEEDRSVEAVNHLAKFVDTEQDMAKWTDICAGVWGTFGDSLPIEGLTEASNETAKVGKLTGVLADALNWAGVNEEDFQASLDKCNSEQERAQLITNTLNGLYSKAAKHYKENNASVIKARKATSEYTDEMADLGAAMEPVNTDISEMKTAFLKELTPAVKNKAIPAIQKFISSCKNSGAIEKLSDAIEFTADNAGMLALGIGSIVVAMKGFAIVSGVTTAIKSMTGAFAGLNAVMTANPVGAVVTGIALLTAGIVALTLATKANATAADERAKKAQETLNNVREEAQAYNDLKTAQQEQAAADMAQIANVDRLNKELQTLVDENGNVTEANRSRVDFILNELNNALGTEYTLVGNQIKGYKELQTEIAKTIEARKAEILLNAQLPIYEEAITKYIDKQMEQSQVAQKLAEQRAITEEAEQKALKARKELQEKLAEAKTEADYRMLASDAQKVAKLEENAEKEKGSLSKLETAYNENETVLQGYYSDISTYESASASMLEGKTGEAIKTLDKRNSAFKTAASVVGKSAEEQKKILEQQVIDTEVNAQLMAERYEQGVEGVTEEMVKTAREQADAAKEEFKKVGGNITEGIGEGAEKKKWTLSGAMSRIITSAVEAAKKAAGIKSPSRLFRDKIGKFISAGVSVGIDDGTGGIVKSIKNQVATMRKAYNVDGIADNLTAVKSDFQTLNNRSRQTSKNGAGAVATRENSVVIHQHNNFSQAHSRYEIWQSEQKAAAAVKLALLGG